MVRLTTTEHMALVEYSVRKNMAVKIFRPIPSQDSVFVKLYSIFLVRGGNRSGKSTTCAAKFAATALDIPITLSDGTQVHQRRPHQRGKPLDMWVIGYDWVHIGMTIYRLLFRGGLYKIIFDPQLGEYRAFRPNDPADAAREDEARNAPPLIPERYIKPGSWSWENKKLRQFRKVEIWNPETEETLAVIYAFPSTAEPKAGDIVDCIWIDEKIETAEHFDEWKARLTDREGHLFWSSWPSVENDALRNISEQAELQADDPNPEYGEVILKFSDNTALPQHIVDKRLKQFTTEAERLARDKGEYVTGLLKMYPEYGDYTHDIHCVDDMLSRTIKDHNGLVPPNWTRDLILDPGTAHPAVLFCAVPPPSIGDYLVVYDEIDASQIDAYRLAQRAKEKSRGYSYNRLIYDNHAARITPMGFGHTIGKQYTDAFKKYGIQLQTGGTYFIPGCDNVAGRISALQKALSLDNGIPRLRIMTKNCPELTRQLKKYLKRVIKKDVEEYVPAPRQQVDLAVCYDQETEVLTDRGWMLFRDLSGTERLATMNLQSEMLEFQFPTNLIEKDHAGEMVRVKGRRVDLLVTPDHRMVVRNRKGRLKVVAASELKKTHSIPMVPPSGWGGARHQVRMPRQFNGRNQVDFVEDVVSFAELIGWYLAEGCCVKYRKKGRGYQVALAQVKGWGCELLEDCLKRNPFHSTRYGDCYLISHKQLWNYLKPFGSRAWNKFVPQWIKDSDVEVIEAFLRGYIAGDGHRRSEDSFSISTTSLAMANDLQELLLKCGRPARIAVRKPSKKGSLIRGGEVKSKRLCYVVSSCSSKEALLYRKGDDGGCESIFDRIPYSGKVYCASVPNGTLVVRRNGVASVSGNCLEYWVASNPRYVKPLQVNKPVADMDDFEYDEAFFNRRKLGGSGSSRSSRPIGPMYHVNSSN